MSKRFTEKYRGSRNSLGSSKVRNTEVQINATSSKYEIKNDFYAAALIDGPEVLMELLRNMIRKSIIANNRILCVRSYRQNEEAILVILSMMDKSPIKTEKLINNYLLKNEPWKRFVATFPTGFIAQLPNPGDFDFKESLKDGISKFAKRLKHATKIKTLPPAKKQKSTSKKTSSLNAKISDQSLNFEKSVSLWLEGLEKKQISREYVSAVNLETFLRQGETDKRFRKEDNVAIGKESENKDYKELLDTSMNPNSLKDYDEFFRRHNTENSAKEEKSPTKTQLVEVRTGQPKFKKEVMKAFKNTCCVSGYSVADALEAAHINDYALSKDNSLSNGLCLRGDIHMLFDKGSLKIDEHYNIQLDKSLSGSQYWQYNGQKIHLPHGKVKPSKANLRIKFNKYS